MGVQWSARHRALRPSEKAGAIEPGTAPSRRVHPRRAPQRNGLARCERPPARLGIPRHLPVSGCPYARIARGITNPNRSGASSPARVQQKPEKCGWRKAAPAIIAHQRARRHNLAQRQQSARPQKHRRGAGPHPGRKCGGFTQGHGDQMAPGSKQRLHRPPNRGRRRVPHPFSARARASTERPELCRHPAVQWETLLICRKSRAEKTRYGGSGARPAPTPPSPHRWDYPQSRRTEGCSDSIDRPINLHQGPRPENGRRPATQGAHKRRTRSVRIGRRTAVRQIPASNLPAQAQAQSANPSSTRGARYPKSWRAPAPPRGPVTRTYFVSGARPRFSGRNRDGPSIVFAGPRITQRCALAAGKWEGPGWHAH